MDGHIADGGPGAVPGAPRAGPIAGELVTETLDYDGGRQVTVYVPPDPPEAIVFAADGGWHISRLSEVVAAADDHATSLRITQGGDSDALVLTRKEARQAAERRVLELEEELRRR